MTYIGPTFYIIWYDPYEKFKEVALTTTGKVRVTPLGYVKPDRIEHNVEISGLVDETHKTQVVHIHINPSLGNELPINVNIYENTEMDDPTTKLIVEFAKLVVSGVVELRPGRLPL